MDSMIKVCKCGNRIYGDAVCEVCRRLAKG
jgi:hypothetical protein